VHTTVKIRFYIEGFYDFCFISWIKTATIGVKTIGYTSYIYVDIYFLFNQKHCILFQLLSKFKFLIDIYECIGHTEPYLSHACYSRSQNCLQIHFGIFELLSAYT